VHAVTMTPHARNIFFGSPFKFTYIFFSGGVRQFGNIYVFDR
jgi:hypothetical protein